MIRAKLEPARRTNPDARANTDDWRILRALAIYRLLLIILLLGLQGFGQAQYLFDQIAPLAFSLILVSYAIPALGLFIANIRGRPGLHSQAYLGFVVDAAAVVTLMYAAHGVGSGLGVLLVTPTLGCALVLPRRIGLLQAAIGTLAVFAEEFWRQSISGYAAREITNAGLLGLMLFATVLGATAIAQRARSSEALATRVGDDLANLSRLNERIVESMDTPVLVVDEKRRLRLLNAAARGLLGKGVDPDGRAVSEILPALDQAMRAWDANPHLERAPLLPRVDGAELLPRFIRLGYGESAPVLVLLDDAARLREQSQQLKLAALGRLSAGIAHEIRNPLSAIHHAGQLLGESAQLGDGDHRLLDMIKRHSVRIDRIVEDVLRLSRRQAASPRNLSLKEFLTRSIAVYLEGCPDVTRQIEIDAIPDDLRLRFDPDHLQQVLHNLWQNSFDHGRPNGAPVRVSLRAGRLDPGQRPYLDIIDNGEGVPAEQQEKLFEPFFTTAHRGTGLGLYLSRELCEYNQARLLHLPRADGAQFRVIFAAANESE